MCVGNRAYSRGLHNMFSACAESCTLAHFFVRLEETRQCRHIKGL
jgi:hypothetical protein